MRNRDDNKISNRGERGRRKRRRFAPRRSSGKGGMAAVMSAIMPGLGHLYAGSIAFGLLVMFGLPVGSYVLVIAGAVGGSETLMVALAIIAAAWVGQIYLAFYAAERESGR